MSVQTPNIHIIAGPTASGKSAKALALAAALDGVIINCDSMQIYDGLPLLTAQPSAEDLKTAPHRLYCTLQPNEHCSAGKWRRMAAPIIEETLEAGLTPIICGGTGLYIKTLVDGLSPIPETPEEVRAGTIKLHEEIGTKALYEKLKERDPEIAAKYHENHSARIMRAWDVLEATGKPLSAWQKQPPVPNPAHWQIEIHKILPERAILHERIETRFDQMVEMGALEEVKDFAQRIEQGEVREDSLLTNALGFKPLRAHLRSECTLDEAITQSKTDTRRYAKRQMTWFNNQL